MKVVIQCAGNKDEQSSTICRNGNELIFVANPSIGTNQCSPWQNINGANGATWIECLRSFNDGIPQALPDGITWGMGFPTNAINLYSNAIYQRLAATIGAQNVYILSAGYGLVRGTDVIPKYNITFSSGAKVPRNARITPNVRVPLGTLRSNIEGDDPIHLFLTPKYISYWLNAFKHNIDLNRLVLHWRSVQSFPDMWRNNGGEIMHDITAKLNWQYIAANQFLDGIQ